MKLTHLLLALPVALATVPAMAAAPLYLLESARTLPSTDTDWDYIKLEPNSNRLFIARRKDGLTVYDIKTGKALSTVANTAGANGPLLLPALNRGYVVTTDGAIVVFELKSLKVIDRIQLTTGTGLNTVSYDPSSKKLQAIMAVQTSEITWYTLDPLTGKMLSKTVFPFRKMDEPAPDGKGSLFAGARYDKIMLRLDSQSLKESTRWNINCEQVVAVDYQAHHGPAIDRLPGG